MEGRSLLVRRVRKTRVMDIKRLQVNDSSYIKGTICLVNVPRGWFSSVGAQTGAIKLAMAGT